MKFLKNTGVTVLALTLSSGFAYANEAKQEEQQTSKDAASEETMKDENLKQVEGTIVNHKFVNVFKDKDEMKKAEKSGKAESGNQMLVVMIKTAKGNERLLVDLGQMKDKPEIKDGESKLQVEGKIVNLGQKQLFVAKRAKLDGTTMTIQRKSS